jgi:putative redox protein
MDRSIRIVFPGDLRIDAEYKGFIIKTDQPVHQGGGGTAPAPFDLFLASLATCAGFYAQSFLTSRHLSTEGLELSLSIQVDREAKMISKITIDIRLPTGFPEKYTKALTKAVDSCTVKKHILSPPEFEINTSVR